MALEVITKASRFLDSIKHSPECRSLERHSLSFLGRVNSAKRFLNSMHRSLRVALQGRVLGFGADSEL
ncbi:hypothetical protein [Leptospira noguchii]|uniref:hypothetical protein n=1 Tax=Leptospira noguchii TaxID=28182 RepID=UPI001FB6E3AD|nr:hypothetical protein [Leptospira noguchii]UOG54304.1 hypothetical protein MAL09_09680 [Leptospira noguchii]